MTDTPFKSPPEVLRNVTAQPLVYPELVRPAKPPRDYADDIADVIQSKWLDDYNDDSRVPDLIARGVREGYALGYGAAQR